MNRIIVIAIMMITFSCAGGNQQKYQLPKHLTEGAKEMRKGIAWYQKGCYQRALEYFSRAHELHVISDQPAGVAMSLNSMGNVYRYLGDVDSAILFYDEAIAIYESLKDRKNVAQVLANKAASLIEAQRLDEAEETLEKAEYLVATEKNIPVSILSNRGILLTRQKQFKQAESILFLALKKTNKDDLLEMATVNFALGSLMQELQRPDEALGFFKKALEADQQAGFHLGMAGDLCAVGTVYMEMNESEKALDYLKRGIKIYALIGSDTKMSSALNLLEELASKTGADLSVTYHFIKQWQSGKALENPCR